MPLDKTNWKSRDRYWGLSSPKCPHCDYEIELSTWDYFDLYEEGEHEVDCPSCEKPMKICTRVSYSFSTDDTDMEGLE